MITVMLATYQGEAYLAQLLDSLLAQTEQRFTVLISDDGSVDQTLAIARQYAAAYPGKFIVHPNETNSGGAQYNFLRMMAQTRGDYLMLCDQDDVWMPHKIEASLAAMQAQEALHGANTPILVHTDMRVVNESLGFIDASFWAYGNINTARTQLKDIVMQNMVTGCTALYNRALAEKLQKVPEFLNMHDWWLALVASAFGVIAAEPSQTVLYRQHSQNAVGAHAASSPGYLLHRLRYSAKVKRDLMDAYEQAASFLALYDDVLSAEQRRFLQRFVKIPQYAKPRRLWETTRLGVWKSGLARKAGQILLG